jgi:hypothetical protein
MKTYCFLIFLFKCIIANFFLYAQNNQIWCIQKDSSTSLPHDIQNSTLLFFGETHEFACNPLITLELLKKLSKNNHKLTLTIEFGFAEAWLYQQYLQSQNSALLAATVYSKYTEYNQFWNDLYSFNQTLPQNKKLRIIGLDFERPKAVKKIFKAALDSLHAHQISATAFIKITQNYLTIKDSSTSMSYAAMQHFFTQLQTTFDKKYITAIFADYQLPIWEIITNKVPFWHLPTNETEQLAYTQKNMPMREKEMYHNLCKQYQKGEQYLAVFGAAHTDLSWNISLAYLLNNRKDSPFQQQVICLNAHYDGCLLDDTTILEESFLHDDILNLKEIDTFKKGVLQQCNIQLIKLNRQNKIHRKILSTGQYLFWITQQKSLQKLNE